MDVVLLEDGHVLHALDDDVAGGAEPDRVDLGRGVAEDERVLQLVQPEAEVLADEVVHLQNKPIIISQDCWAWGSNLGLKVRKMEGTRWGK